MSGRPIVELDMVKEVGVSCEDVEEEWQSEECDVGVIDEDQQEGEIAKDRREEEVTEIPTTAGNRKGRKRERDGNRGRERVK